MIFLIPRESGVVGCPEIANDKGSMGKIDFIGLMISTQSYDNSKKRRTAIDRGFRGYKSVDI